MHPDLFAKSVKVARGALVSWCDGIAGRVDWCLIAGTLLQFAAATGRIGAMRSATVQANDQTGLHVGVTGSGPDSRGLIGWPGMRPLPRSSGAPKPWLQLAGDQSPPTMVQTRS
jgi:hypothetical protein